MPISGKGFRYTSLKARNSNLWPFEKASRTGERASSSSWWCLPYPLQGWMIHCLLAVFWVLAFSILVYIKTHPPHKVDPDSTSPLMSVLNYRLFHFRAGFGTDTTIFQGAPNAANRAAWANLTNTGIVSLYQREHKLLPEHSALIDDSPKTGPTFIGAVEVFYQLHCLDVIRRELYGDLTDWIDEYHSSATKQEYLDHCIDYLRQSLMCRPSIEIIPFDVNKEHNPFKPRWDAIHTCVDFDRIRDWTVERQTAF